MRPIRKVILVEVNNEVFGFFGNFRAAYETLKSEYFELKGYKNEIKKFARMQALKLLAVKRGVYFYTVKISKTELNHSMMVLRPVILTN